MANPNLNLSNLTPFRPGQSGKPAGRPVQSRNRITGAFLAALADDFDEHRRSAIVACREQSPSRYLAIFVSPLLKQLEIAPEKPAREMTRKELEAEIEWTNERALAQEQFEKDWYAAQATLSPSQAK